MKNQYRGANRLKRRGSDSLKIKGGREGRGGGLATKRELVFWRGEG